MADWVSNVRLSTATDWPLAASVLAFYGLAFYDDRARRDGSSAAPLEVRFGWARAT